jgi:hypothetical protein
MTTPDDDTDPVASSSTAAADVAMRERRGTHG